MVIRFDKVKMHNFCSYVDAEVDLKQKGFCLVSGRNNYKKDNALSNGSGKSTIWSAICYALTGETVSGTKVNLKNINTEETDCYVTLYFSVDKDSYVVTRIYSPKSNLKVLKNDIDISGKTLRESEKILSENLPDLNKDLISTTIILGQGLPHKFTSYNPSGRKDLLEKLTKSDFMIDDIKLRILNRQSDLDKQLRELEDSLLINKTQLSTVKSTLDRLKKEKDSWTEINYEEIIPDLEAHISELSTQKTKLESEATKLDEESILLNNSILKMSATKSEELGVELTSYMNARNEIVEKRTEASTKINYLKSEIAKYAKIKDVCPTCGQKIPGIIKPDTSSQSAEIDKLQKELTEYDSVLLTYENKHKEYLNDIENRYSIISQNQNKVNEIKINVSNIRAKITSLANDILVSNNTLMQHKFNFENHKKALEKLLLDIDNYQATEIQLENSIDVTMNAKVEVEAHVAVLKKIESLVKRDFRGYLLNNIVEYLNRKAKEYSNIVFGTDELAISIDGNAIDISYCSKAYEALSGGEKQRVDVIVQFAIRDLLQTYFNYSSNILVLDEITDNLDKLATDRIFELINNQLKDVESIFIISHHDDELSIDCDSTLVINKTSCGISEVVSQ